jgi:hypothetical protein
MDLEGVVGARQRGQTLAHVAYEMSRDGLLPKGDQREVRVAAAALDCFERNESLRMVPPAVLRDPSALLNHLRAIRPTIPKQRGSGHYSLSHLVHALHVGGRIPVKGYRQLAMMASAAELFDSNTALNTIPDDVLEDPQTLMRYLRRVRIDIGSPRTGDDSPGLSYCIYALIVGGKIPSRKKKGLMMTAGAVEYYDANPLLKSIPPDVLGSKEKLMQYLVMNRGEMTTPGGRSGDLETTAGTSTDEIKQHNSLVYLVRALYGVGEITSKQNVTYGFEATAAEYALRRREIIEDEIVIAYRGTQKSLQGTELMSALQKKIDRHKFKHLKDPSKSICLTYFKNVIKYAMLFYGNKAIGKAQ